jgi:hypothetical protein
MTGHKRNEDIREEMRLVDVNAIIKLSKETARTLGKNT